jgi:hypothetical protein
VLVSVSVLVFCLFFVFGLVWFVLLITVTLVTFDHISESLENANSDFKQRNATSKN